jgi:alpha-L-rhamnosidase
VDSPYVASGAFALLREASMEKDLFENYLLPEKYDYVPEHTFPVVYPADQTEQFWLPHQNFHVPIQLEEYFHRSGDRAMVDGFEAKLLAYFDWIKQYENEDGLLEKLPGWLWIEWSISRTFGHDVNYPINMNYTRALAVMGRLYDRTDFAEKSDRLKRVILEQSYDGQFFIDNAVREDGKLRRTGNRTEVCQYYAFESGVATPKSHPVLWKTLRDDFGPKRRLSEHVVASWPEIHVANSLPGFIIRLDLLSRFGESQTLFEDSIHSFHHMAKLTNTLWEHMDPSDGLCHGFQGHICDLLYRDALALHEVDTVNKRVTLRFTKHSLEWCKGRIPIGDSFIEHEWHKEDGVIRYRLSMPPGYHVDVDNQSGLSVARFGRSCLRSCPSICPRQSDSAIKKSQSSLCLLSIDFLSSSSVNVCMFASTKSRSSATV